MRKQPFHTEYIFLREVCIMVKIGQFSTLISLEKRPKTSFLEWSHLGAFMTS